MASSIRGLQGPVRALFTDLDGTLTTDGRVEASTYLALEELTKQGVPVIIVTGRPAGWGQALAALTGAAAVITENGGVTFIRDGSNMRKHYGVPAASLPEWRRRMRIAAVDVMQEVPGARLSEDSKYREVDLAIDWNEHASLTPEEAEQVVTSLRAQGFTAVRSSVHVNFGPPKFDKLSAVKRVIADVFDGDPTELAPYVYVGDALNDAPLFAGIPNSVGVANIRSWWNELPDKPAFITDSEEGAGLRELVARILEVN